MNRSGHSSMMSPQSQDTMFPLFSNTGRTDAVVAAAASAVPVTNLPFGLIHQTPLQPAGAGSWSAIDEAKRRLEMAESWATQAAFTIETAKQMMVEAQCMGEAANKMKESALQMIEEVCCRGTLPLADVAVASNIAWEGKNSWDGNSGPAESLKGRRKRRRSVSPSSEESKTQVSQAGKTNHNHLNLKKRIIQEAAKQAPNHQFGTFPSPLLTPNFSPQPEQVQKNPVKLPESRKTSRNNSFTSHKNPQKSRYNLTPVQKIALREAVQSAVRDPFGKINQSSLQRAVEAGLPKRSVLNAAAVAVRRRLESKKPRGSNDDTTQTSF
ncbi:hypothetical protein ACHAXS_001400 [Conticribra weissflogii]